MDIKYKRILLKLSGEALSSEKAVLCDEAVKKTARQIKHIADAGVEVALVIGGGNILRGRSSKDSDRNRADHMGMLSTAINSLAMQGALESIGVESVVLSAVEMQRFCETYSSRAAMEALSQHKVVIFACGTGCPYFSTDTAAALRAIEIKANALMLAKNIDAVYSADPRIDKNAVRYSALSYDKVIADNLKATDITTITLCRDYKLPIIFFELSSEDNFMRALCGENVGTIISEG